MANLSRRKFLESSAGIGVLTIAIAQTPYILAQETPDNTGLLTPCLHFDQAGAITLYVPSPEMGQGMSTTGALMIAEELDLNLDQVSVKLMPYVEKRVGMEFYQGSGGSGSTMRTWNQVRSTAAFARDLFIEAASRQWQEAALNLFIEDGHVVNKANGDRIPFANLVQSARNFMGGSLIPENSSPKPNSAHKRIGKNQPIVHGKEIVTGAPLFGIDVDIPNMLHAVIKRCPHLRGHVKTYDDSAATAMPGVKQIVPIARIPEATEGWRRVAAGIAVVADTYWQAKTAADKLNIEWDGSVSKDDDTTLLKSKAIESVNSADMRTTIEAGNLEAAFNDAKSTSEATYYHPHWAHTCMEPHNCVADVKPDGAEIWTGHQFPGTAISGAAEVTGLPASKIKSNFYRMGTGLGRKNEQDYVKEACLLSKAVGAPIKVTWSREDEIEQDYVNYMGAYKIRAAVNDNGELSAWHMRAAGDAFLQRPTVGFPARLIDTYKGEAERIPNHITRGAWRGPTQNVTAWVVQSFLNEVATDAGLDPLAFLTKLYSQKQVLKDLNWPNGDHDFRRYIAVLEKAAELANYHTPLPSGWGRGIAVNHTFVSVCAHVVDVEMIGDSDYKVHKVTSAIDCGYVVNPLGVKAQVESGIIDGLCAAKYGNWRLERGVPVSNNFDTYTKMRMDECPDDIEIHLLETGDTEPRGTGEVALPPVIPALTNAIFAASGKRVRTLPISENL
ncbi:MAG: molybdopterin cofactor-binding domain-containing protein [Kordiimonas sp.]